MGTRVVAHSVGTASTSLVGVLGCSGCTSGSKSWSNSGLSWALVFLSCWNRLRVGVSVAVSVLVTLVVRFGGDELGRGLRVRRFAVGGSCADAPRIFDVAVMRVRLGLKRSLSEC